MQNAKRKSKDYSSLSLGERGDRKAVGEGVCTETNGLSSPLHFCLLPFDLLYFGEGAVGETQIGNKQTK
jgi:hypothetical protein